MALRLFASLLLGFFVLVDASAAATGALLSKRILPADLARREAMDLLELHVSDMPRVQSASQWTDYADNLRQEALETIIFRGVPDSWRAPNPKIEWTGDIPGGPGYKIRKLRYEALPGCWIPAVLYVPDNLTGKVPATLNLDGHTPESIAWDHYQARCINAARRGMLALHPQWVGFGQLAVPGFAHGRMNQLDLCGVSGVAVFYLAMSRGIDVLLSLPNTDPERLAVTGLSGGGWQTIILSSLDTRVKLSMPVAGYSGMRTRARNMSDLGDSEQAPVDLGITADYTNLTALLAPRPACLTYNAKDNCCFRADHALQPLLDVATPIYTLLGHPERLRSHVNQDDGHNYGVDNRQVFYTMLRDFFYNGDPKFNTTEIDCASELKTMEDFNVPLPENNADFHSLAMQFAQSLPKEPAVPSDPAELKTWQTKKREELAQLVRAHDYEVAVVASTPETAGPVKLTWRQFKLGKDWTVLAADAMQGEPKETVLLVADGGRASVTPEAEALVDAGARVVVIDPLFFGEGAVDWNQVRFSIHISSAGERPVGIQASEIIAVARWLKKEQGVKSVKLVSIGPRSSQAALIATGLDAEAIDALETRAAMRSLKEIIERNMDIGWAPDLFCFGLLESFDVPQLSALVAPRALTVKEDPEHGFRSPEGRRGRRAR